MEEKEFLKELQRFRRGYRLQIIFNLLNTGIILSIFIILISYLYNLLMIRPINLPVWSFFIPIFIFIIYALIVRIRIEDLGSKIDRELNLKNRFITSIAFLKSNDDFAKILLRDTAKFTKDIDSASLFPVKWNKTLLLIGLLMISLVLLRNTGISSSYLLNRMNDTDMVIREEGERIKQVSEKIKDDRLIDDQTKMMLTQRLDKIGEQFQAGGIEKSDALLMLSDITEFIKKKDPESINMVSGNVDEKKKDNKQKMTSGTGSESSGKEYMRELLNSMAIASRHIGEGNKKSEMRSKREEGREGSDSGSNSGKGSGRGNIGENESVSLSGNHSDEGGSAIAGKIRSETSMKDETKIKSGEIDGIIKEYKDTTINLESLPPEYRQIVIKYFDSISKE